MLYSGPLFWETPSYTKTSTRSEAFDSGSMTPPGGLDALPLPLGPSPDASCDTSKGFRV